MNSKQLATVMRMLSETATVAAMSKSAGVTRQTLYRTLSSLRAARVARIAAWNRDKNNRAIEPVWGLGDQPEAPRLGLTNAQRQRNYRQRLKKAQAVMNSIATVIGATGSSRCSKKARTG